MRNFEKVSQLFGVIEPEHVSHGSNHEHLEGDRIVFSKLLIKERKKPEKFWLPHGRPSDDRAFAFSSRVFPKASQIKALYKLWHYQISNGPGSRHQMAERTSRPRLSSRRVVLMPALRRGDSEAAGRAIATGTGLHVQGQGYFPSIRSLIARHQQCACRKRSTENPLGTRV